MTSGATPTDIVALVQAELEKAADPEKAPQMAAYMKTSMPFYGVMKPDRLPLMKSIKRRYKPGSKEEYEETVRALWSLPHREEKYVALDYAVAFVKLARPDTLALYESLVREGAWWDFVDVIASHLVGTLLLQYRQEIAPVLDGWIDDGDFWIRRTAILSQLRHKDKTDDKTLFRYCLKRADEQEFFIRKAIGWALRQYSYTAPDEVMDFLLEHRQELSGLSYREGAKNLRRIGLMTD